MGKKVARVLFTCIIVGSGAPATKKSQSTAPLRATLGPLRAGSPFGVLPQPSLEGMSALSASSASRTQLYIQTVWAQNPKPQNPKSILISNFWMCFWMCLMQKPEKKQLKPLWKIATPRSYTVPSNVFGLLGHWSVVYHHVKKWNQAHQSLLWCQILHT